MFLKLVIFLVLYNIILIVHGQNKTQTTWQYGNDGPRIFDGIPAKITEFPYIVSVGVSYHDKTYNQRFTTRCTGSILTTRWVLTAAHCFTDAQKDKNYVTTVTAGTNDFNVIDVYTQVRTSIKNVIHNLDRLNYSRDVALIKVGKPFVFNDHVGYVRLTSKALPSGRRIDCMMVGFGLVDADGDADNSNMFRIPGYVDDCEALRKGHSWWNVDEHVCVATALNGTSACPGDSGGPLICNGLLEGTLTGSKHANKLIISECGDSDGSYQIYMSAHYYGPWIRKYVFPVDGRRLSSIETNNAGIHVFSPCFGTICSSWFTQLGLLVFLVLTF